MTQLALCAGYAALVLYSASWAEARQLDAIFPFYAWRIRLFSAAELMHAWQFLAGIAGILGSTAVALSATSRHQPMALRKELWQATTRFLSPLSRLPKTQQRFAAGALLGLTALRVMESLPTVTPGYDDVPSYELFASKSLLAVSAYYPVPNNHVLSNSISWAFYQLNPGFWFTMRLPVLMVTTAATILLFAGLVWAGMRFRPALLATLLFSLAQLSLYHVAVGRGYWLLTLLAGVVFFCTLALRQATRQPRAAWLGLAVGGVLGLYTVPTFALVLASAFSWLGLGYLRGRPGPSLPVLAAMGCVIGAGGLLLYTPLLFVSGATIFFSNGFVAPHPTAEFLRGLPGYLWQAEGFLAGQMKIGGLLTLAGLLGTGVLWYRARAGQLPSDQLPAWQRLVPAALWFMLLPYVVLATQRVFAPERALLYKAFFFFMLLALVVDWLLRLERPHLQRWLRPALSAFALLWMSYQLSSLWRDNRPPARRNAALYEAFRWLEQQPRGPLLIPESTQSLFVRMYLHSERPGQNWLIDTYPQPQRRYTYVLAFPSQRGFFQPRFAYPPAFHNEQADIYLVTPAEAQPDSVSGLPSYWHLAH